MLRPRLPLRLAFATLALPLFAACGDDGTGLAALQALRIEGRAYDVATDSGVPGVEVFVVSDGGASGVIPITSRATTDSLGAYRISEDFAVELLCDPAAWQLVVNLPDGWSVAAGGQPLECVESTQPRDIPLTR